MLLYHVVREHSWLYIGMLLHKSVVTFSCIMLLGDVGGYMGLLLGASVVTVFELLDVLIYGFILKIKVGTERFA